MANNRLPIFGPLELRGNKVEGLADGSADNDAVNFSQVNPIADRQAAIIQELAVRTSSLISVNYGAVAYTNAPTGIVDLSGGDQLDFATNIDSVTFEIPTSGFHDFRVDDIIILQNGDDPVIFHWVSGRVSSAVLNETDNVVRIILIKQAQKVDTSATIIPAGVTTVRFSHEFDQLARENVKGPYSPVLNSDGYLSVDRFNYSSAHDAWTELRGHVVVDGAPVSHTAPLGIPFAPVEISSGRSFAPGQVAYVSPTEWYLNVSGNVTPVRNTDNDGFVDTDHAFTNTAIWQRLGAGSTGSGSVTVHTNVSLGPARSNVDATPWAVGSGSSLVRFATLNAGDEAVGLQTDADKMLAALGVPLAQNGVAIASTQLVTLNFRGNSVNIPIGTMITLNTATPAILFDTELNFGGVIGNNPSFDDDVQIETIVTDPVFESGSNIQLTINEDGAIEYASTEADIETGSTLPGSPNSLDLFALTEEYNDGNQIRKIGIYVYLLDVDETVTSIVSGRTYRINAPTLGTNSEGDWTSVAGPLSARRGDVFTATANRANFDDLGDAGEIDFAASDWRQISGAVTAITGNDAPEDGDVAIWTSATNLEGQTFEEAGIVNSTALNTLSASIPVHLVNPIDETFAVAHQEFQQRNNFSTRFDHHITPAVTNESYDYDFRWQFNNASTSSGGPNDFVITTTGTITAATQTSVTDTIVEITFDTATQDLIEASLDLGGTTTIADENGDDHTITAVGLTTLALSAATESGDFIAGNTYTVTYSIKSITGNLLFRPAGAVNDTLDVTVNFSPDIIPASTADFNVVSQTGTVILPLAIPYDIFVQVQLGASGFEGVTFNNIFLGLDHESDISADPDFEAWVSGYGVVNVSANGTYTIEPGGVAWLTTTNQQSNISSSRITVITASGTPAPQTGTFDDGINWGKLGDGTSDDSTAITAGGTNIFTALNTFRLDPVVDGIQTDFDAYTHSSILVSGQITNSNVNVQTISGATRGIQYLWASTTYFRILFEDREELRLTLGDDAIFTKIY